MGIRFARLRLRGRAAAFVLAAAVAGFAFASHFAALAQQPLSEATKRLFSAVYKNDLPETQSSIALGADVFARNERGQTPTELAVDQGHFEIAHYLLSVRNVLQAIALAEPPRAPTPALPTAEEDAPSDVADASTPEAATSPPAAPLPRPSPGASRPPAPQIVLSSPESAPPLAVPSPTEPRPASEIAELPAAPAAPLLTPEIATSFAAPPPEPEPQLAAPGEAATAAVAPESGGSEVEQDSAPGEAAVEPVATADLTPSGPLSETGAVSPKPGLIDQIGNFVRQRLAALGTSSGQESPTLTARLSKWLGFGSADVQTASTTSAPPSESDAAFLTRLDGLLKDEARGQSEEIARLAEKLDAMAQEEDLTGYQPPEEPMPVPAWIVPTEPVAVAVAPTTEPQGLTAVQAEPPMADKVAAEEPEDVLAAIAALPQTPVPLLDRPAESPGMVYPPLPVEPMPGALDEPFEASPQPLAEPSKVAELWARLASLFTGPKEDQPALLAADDPPRPIWFDRLAALVEPGGSGRLFDRVAAWAGFKGRSAEAPIAATTPIPDSDTAFLTRLNTVLDAESPAPAPEADLETFDALALVTAPDEAAPSPVADSATPAPRPTRAAPPSGAADDYLDRLAALLDSGSFNRPTVISSESGRAVPSLIPKEAPKPSATEQVAAAELLSEDVLEKNAPALPTAPVPLALRADPTAPPNPLGFARKQGDEDAEKPKPAPRPRAAPAPKPKTEGPAVAKAPVQASDAANDPLGLGGQDIATPAQPSVPERGAATPPAGTQVASLGADPNGWAVKQVQVAKVAPALPKQHSRVLTPRDYLKGVVLTLGNGTRMGKAPGTTANAAGERQGCVIKGAPSLIFCIEPVDWPANMRHHFEVSTIMYVGARAIVRYDREKATYIYSLFESGSFDVITNYLEERYGPPTEAVRRVIAPLAQPRMANPTLIWRSVDPNTNMITNLEIRRFDDARGGFPDTRHGVILLHQAWAPPIFPLLSQLELMRIVK